MGSKNYKRKVHFHITDDAGKHIQHEWVYIQSDNTRVICVINPFTGKKILPGHNDFSNGRFSPDYVKEFIIKYLELSTEVELYEKYAASM